MTEDEALTKWCPHVRIAVSKAGPFTSRGVEQYVTNATTRCLASGCMAWTGQGCGLSPDVASMNVVMAQAATTNSTALAQTVTDIAASVAASVSDAVAAVVTPPVISP